MQSWSGDPENVAEPSKMIVIPREEAVFRLDRQGYWRNAGGRFKKKKIIDHFHRAIDRDENGYFLLQDKGGVWEKVYFPYEDTALFVFDVQAHNAGDQTETIRLTLNTGRQMDLAPDQLYIHRDNLYMMLGDERVKLAERAMIKIAKRLKEDDQGWLCLAVGNRTYPIPEK